MSLRLIELVVLGLLFQLRPVVRPSISPLVLLTPLFSATAPTIDAPTIHIGTVAHNDESQTGVSSESRVEES